MWPGAAADGVAARREGWWFRYVFRFVQINQFTCLELCTLTSICIVMYIYIYVYIYITILYCIYIYIFIIQYELYYIYKYHMYDVCNVYYICTVNIYIYIYTFYSRWPRDAAGRRPRVGRRTAQPGHMCVYYIYIYIYIYRYLIS